jgi:hypothetical protein
MVKTAGRNGSFFIPAGKTPEYISGTAMKEKRLLPGICRRSGLPCSGELDQCKGGDAPAFLL